MELNIQAIADEKIKAMHESGQIKTQIEEDVEKLILRSVDDALDGYQIRRGLEKNITESVSETLKSIDFTTYNGFIAQKVKQITEEVLREDVTQKIEKVFNDMLIVKNDGIKLSEIFDAYRKWVNEDVEENEQYERQNFVCEIEEHESGSFTHYTMKFNDEELDHYDQPQIEFGICRYKDEAETNISRLSIDGKNTKNTFCLGHLSKIQTLLANLYFNETKIILDIDDIDDSNGFDAVDY